MQEVSNVFGNVFRQQFDNASSWCRYGWQDGLFDVTWSEVNEAVLVVAGGDGNVLIFDQGVTQVK